MYTAVLFYGMMIAGITSVMFENITGRNGRVIYDIVTRFIIYPNHIVGKWCGDYGHDEWGKITDSHFRKQLYRLPRDCKCTIKRVAQYGYNIGTILVCPSDVDYNIITGNIWNLVV